MFLSEMVRLLGKEQNLINDPATYSRSGTSWGTLKDYGNITLSEATMLIARYKISNTNNQSGSNPINFRLKIGGVYVDARPWSVPGYTSVTEYRTLYAWVGAGTKSVVAESINLVGNVSISEFQLGACPFADTTYRELAGYSSQFTLNLAARRTCLGTVKAGVLHLQAYASTSGQATNFENPGESLMNGVSVYVDGVQRSWSERWQDAYSGTYGGAAAKLRMELAAGQSHTVSFSKRNAGTAVSCTAILCPWLPYETMLQPLEPGYPQGSTVYVTLEPLTADPEKSVYAGKPRAVSLGEATDYYSKASGTGVLAFYYTLESVDASSCPVYVSGNGACVSVIGVDVR
jgi:hypothetical protein